MGDWVRLLVKQTTYIADTAHALKYGLGLSCIY